MGAEDQNFELTFEAGGMPRLSAEDAAAVDVLLDVPALRMAGEQNGHSATVSVERKRVMADLLAKLSSVPEPVVPATLLERTLARVEEERRLLHPTAVAEQEEEAPADPQSFSRTLRQFGVVGVAAAVLVAVFIPGLIVARQDAKTVACAANMRDAGFALATFGAAHNGALPRVAGMSDSWLASGPGVSAGGARAPRSNFDNLLPLVQEKLLRYEQLLCPGRDEVQAAALPASFTSFPDDARGYSFVNLCGPVNHAWKQISADAVPAMILADRNPLFVPRVAGRWDMNSLNHGQQGNNILTNDQAVRFEHTPDAGPRGDNIWTVAGKEHVKYVGTEVVTTADDVFLSP